MGQFVRFDGTGYGTVTIPAFPSNVWRVRWRMQLDANQGSDRTFYLLGKTSGISNYLRFEDKADPTQNRVFLRIQNFSISLTAPNIDWTTDSIYEVESDGTNTRFIKDGTPVGNAQTVSYLFHQDLNYIGRNDGSIAPAGLDLYWLEIYQGGTIEHDYQPDSTGGTGTTLDDVAVGNADATLVGFTGSPWVEFFTIESVTNSTFEPGQTITFTTTAGFNPTSITISDGAKTCSPTLISEAAADTYSFVLPLGDIAGFPEFGALTLTATNGSDNADTQLTMNVPTGYAEVSLNTSILRNELSASFQFPAHPNGGSYLIDSSIITIDQYNELSINAGQTYSTTAYLLNSQGLQEFTISEGQAPADTTDPVITILGDNPVTITEGDTYNDAGATATDDTDGNITGNINVSSNVNTSTVGTYTVTYSVSDAAGNSAQATRTVNVQAATPAPDTTDPVITITGSNPVTITEGDTYTDAGATATDNVDGDVTANINTVSTVNTSAAGSYTVTYSVSDAAGNSAQAVRNVIVESQPVTPPVVDTPSKKELLQRARFTLDGERSALAYEKAANQHLYKFKVRDSTGLDMVGKYLDLSGNDITKVVVETDKRKADTAGQDVIIEGENLYVKLGSLYTRGESGLNFVVEVGGAQIVLAGSESGQRPSVKFVARS